MRELCGKTVRVTYFKDLFVIGNPLIADEGKILEALTTWGIEDQTRIHYMAYKDRFTQHLANLLEDNGIVNFAYAPVYLSQSKAYEYAVDRIKEINRRARKILYLKLGNNDPMYKLLTLMARNKKLKEVTVYDVTIDHFYEMKRGK